MTGLSVLVTGGLGNVGRWVVDALVERGHRVAVLSSRPTAFATARVITADIGDLGSCAVLRNQAFDVVIHAASANDQHLPNYFATALRTNALGTRNLLEVLVPPRHFIYLSTFQVYGTTSGEIDEQTPVAPQTDYAATHLFAEHYVQQFHAKRGLPYTILRLTNGYGCPKTADTTKWYLLFNDLARMAVQHRRLVLRTNGRALRDFIWLGTVSEVMAMLSEHAALNGVYNLASERSYTLLEVATFIQCAYEQQFGQRIPLETNAADSTDSGEALHVSAQKLRRLLPYSPPERFVEEAQKIFKLLGAPCA